MLIKPAADIKPSEVTPERVYHSRRRFMRDSLAGVAGAGAATAVATSALALPADWLTGREVEPGDPIGEQMTSKADATGYNNFYEFGTGKSDPAKNAHTLRPRPWTVEVEGLCANPGTYGLEDFIKPGKMEDRVYRLRCVEAWSIVVPWHGFSLQDVIDRAKPLGSAGYVEFTTLYDLEQMPMQRSSVLEWPYVEALRLDEASHPLTMLVTGVYGRELPNQNGAPLRLVIPWKYGFKGIKSIVKMRFTETQPMNTWQQATPWEYGFYANVNPAVDHPRWSPARERRLGEFRKRRTLMLNGYGGQVASLYSGMDLRVNF